jgi:hypothetical protein
MLRMASSIVLVGLLLAGGAGLAVALDEKGGGDKAVSENTARFERLKGLAGTWKSVARAGEETMEGTFTYRVTAAGSAVMETLFVDTPHEMVTIYTLDGDDLVLTHYCAAGNQPRMKAEKGGDANSIKFAFDRLGGGDPAKDMHMHEGTITFVDETHVRAEYQGWQDGKPDAGHKAVIVLEKVK